VSLEINQLEINDKTLRGRDNIAFVKNCISMLSFLVCKPYIICV